MGKKKKDNRGSRAGRPDVVVVREKEEVVGAVVDQRNHLLVTSVPYCDYGMYNKGNLTVHLRTHSGEHPFVCQIAGCGRAFSVKSNRMRHYCRYAGIKRFDCPFQRCEYKCDSKGYLTQHLRTHSGEKPFACSYCDFRKAWRTSLRAHERCAHCEEKRVKDTDCDYRCEKDEEEGREKKGLKKVF